MSGAGFASHPSRLKAVRLDPLESVGLPSKGDNRYVGPPLYVECADGLAGC